MHAGLAARLDESKNNTSYNGWQELALDIAKLGKSLADATSFLSAYDQRQCQAVRSHTSRPSIKSDSPPPTIANKFIGTDLGGDPLYVRSQNEIHV
jgi:hypothetical protein